MKVSHNTNAVSKKLAANCWLILMLCFCLNTTAQSTVEYDIVLSGGRVIDPETKLDAIKNVGIINNRIAQISSEPLKGKQTIKR
jgi:hypothetical protein